MSERDKKLLIGLGIIFLIAIFYFVPYRILKNKEKSLINEVNELEATYSKMEEDVKKKEEYISGIEKFKLDISDYDKQLPAKVTQEFIFNTIDEMEQKLYILFPTLTFDEGEILFSLNEVENEEDDEQDNEEKMEEQEEIDVLNTNKEDNKQLQEIATKHTINTSVELSYKQLKSLLSYLYEDGQSNRIVINNLALTFNEEKDNLNASFSLSYYGLESSEREIKEVDLGTYSTGKETVFPTGANTSNFTGGTNITEYTKPKEDIADFFIMLNPITSDNTTAIIGEGGDETRSSYVYADKNEIVNAEVEFYQQNNKYYYRFKIEGESNPKNYTTGNVFDPGKILEVQVFSVDRINEDDNSGMKLDIINNTDLPANIIYYSEDNVNPRLDFNKIEGDVIIH